MSLTLPEPPKQGLDIISEVLISHRGVDNVAGRFVNQSAPNETLTVSIPHQVYFIGLESISRGEMLSAAKLVGWRYLLLKGDVPQAAAELSLNGDRGNLEFSQINEGPFVEGTVQTVAFAEGLDETRASDFEVRFLKIPSLHVFALWLKGESDIVIPLSGSHSALKPGTTYTEDELIKALQAPATEILNSTDEGKGS